MSEAIDWTQVDWKGHYLRVSLVAAGKLNRLSWRGKRFGPIPGGKTAHDFAHDAILKTLSGERTWNRDKSLYDHLVGIVSSEISHLVESPENRRTMQADEKIVNIADHLESPETIAIRKSEEQRFLASLETKKPMLRRLAEKILYDPEGGGTPELAVQLNLSIREVDSLKRALRRATEEFLEGDGQSNPGESHGS